MRLAITKHGRMLRSGAALPANDKASPALRDAAAALGHVSQNLRTTLDAIAADELATPREKRADAKKAVEMARESYQRVVSKVVGARDAVGASIQALRDVQHGYESKIGPVGIERIRRRGDAIRQAGADAMLDAMRDFERRRDLDGLLALSLDGDEQPLRVFARVARPQQVAQLEVDLPLLRDLLRHAEGVGAGIDEIAAQDDAHAVPHAHGSDLLEEANTPTSNERLPATWPGFLL
jgi:hypothetical protein